MMPRTEDVLLEVCSACWSLLSFSSRFGVDAYSAVHVVGHGRKRLGLKPRNARNHACVVPGIVEDGKG